MAATLNTIYENVHIVDFLLNDMGQTIQSVFVFCVGVGLFSILGVQVLALGGMPNSMVCGPPGGVM